ncbi:Abi family protein [Mammaliicoccus sciuri]|uniref:Abi family protein n=1 Tax=Mammaliicoccus sciuri TaxID=1296 RepID=UPI001FB3A61F|nr:Abi family protein [Mammaliicoccus sciuri]MCJ0933562.1 Abi family protein [Mammaliicoccus sciuri]
MKPFEKHNKQLKILKSRGLNYSKDAKRHLENENYYNIINGYKDLFLQLDKQGRPVTPEMFVPNTHFNEIFGLYKLDRRLRNTLLEYLLVFETNVKSRVAYFFSEKYTEPHSYLYFKNYSHDVHKTDSIVRTVATISRVMSNNTNKPLKHYMNKHNGVPLWVLVNYLTIGNISHMYLNLDDDLREKIVMDYKTKLKREYNKILQIEPLDLDSILNQVNLFRNVCAHEERLYDYSIRKPKVRKNLFANYNKLYNKSLTPTINGSYMYDLLVSLSIFLNKKDFRKLLENLNKNMDYYSKDFSTVKINDLFIKMGFPTGENFKSLINK